MQNCNDDEEQDLNDWEMPTLNVDGITLERIVNFLHHHLNETIADPIHMIEKPLPSNESAETIFGEWYDAQFKAINKEELFQLVMAANYLDIPILLQLFCTRVAFNMRSMSSQELKKFLEEEQTT